eukprot:TRINITY_DN5501_c0_g1_i1.p1 TRINITY_DN5501_c0_g1~~TRINITY_DN5501_c0_g1_i1.p1  ORF type:complete len:121 (+),score=12.76 TRINITY_DN5501_c0_g1_i1:276-638(+)
MSFADQFRTSFLSQYKVYTYAMRQCLKASLEAMGKAFGRLLSPLLKGHDLFWIVVSLVVATPTPPVTQLTGGTDWWHVHMSLDDIGIVSSSFAGGRSGSGWGSCESGVPRFLYIERTDSG